ncbi:molybdenum cofactor guanylyltransferase [Neotamlana laminarinivorans]|uniref:Probable molybdenum cofactor guanylyltransferase n=1 Tax=Neotamlana laminarinivorans TaxID=2883124 RepID=A0A9X1L0Y9_9FLAO|nr:molybdenum cofactor guanylyltransferase [Tamlana laminarinivorans]MCB4798105.1 molybdenum cofactor guanylyltransferase [Tamlana laminarinivorans]
MTNKNNITGIVLAGGKSSRMGTDKGFLKIDGKHFVEYSIEALKPLTTQVLIVSDNVDYNIFNCERIPDTIKNSGPVSGIYSGLTASKTKWNLILSCDIPLIKTEILQKLLNEIPDNFDAVLTKSNNKLMPLIGLYKKSCSNTFKNALENNEKRLQMVLKSLKTKQIVLKNNEQQTTTNINTPNELKAIKNANNY